MTAKMYVFSSVLVAFLLLLPGSHSKEVCIVPDSSTQHLPPSCGSTSTVEQLCGGEGIQDDTVAVFIGGIHKLSKVCAIQDVKNVVFKALNVTEVSIHCSSSYETGFKSIGTSALTVSGLELIGCGLSHNFSSDGPVIVAMMFANGSDLTLTNVKVSDPKLAGIYVYNVVGNVTVDSSTVSNASYNLIRYTNRVTGATQFTMSNCLLENSRYPAHNYSGGVSILAGNPNLEVKLVNNRFIRNQAYLGGHLSIFFFDFVPVLIINSSFIEGNATQFGGGASFLFSVNATTTTRDFEFLSILNSTFLNNVARTAGGLSIIWTESSPEGGVHITITDTTFDGNSLKGGVGGVALMVFDTDYLSAHPPTHLNVTISRCFFTNHDPNTSFELQYILQSSVIAAIDVPYLVMDSVVVKSNNCTALMAVDSTIIFHGSSIFSNNTAIRGGGFRLTNCMMRLTLKSEVTITDNFAYGSGGGIVIEDPLDCFVENSCFLKWYNETNQTETSLTISNNVALEGGDEIFGNVKACSILPARFVLDLPKNSLSRPSVISSTPQYVCIDRPKEGRLCSKKKEIAVYPGQKVTLFLHVVGQFNGSVAGTVSASAMGGAVIKDIEKSQSVDMHGKDITYSVYLSQDEFMEKPYIKLQPLEYDCPFKTGSSQIKVTFIDCPFGFSLVNNSLGALECQCNLDSSSIVNCSIESQTILKKPLSWVGMIELDNKSYLASASYCPLDYCEPSFLEIKSLPTGLDQDEQCRYNRTGILCGSCPKGWSMVLGSSECCDNCSNVRLLLIIPFALAGILLVVAIHYLNLTVAMGTVGGLIFYANVLQDYSVEILSSKHHSVSVLTSILKIFLSWFNLDLGFSTCFYEGMDMIGKTMLLFVFPVYVLLISATIVLISSRSVFFTRLVGGNSVKILSTLILLSYSKLLRAAFEILNLKFVDVLGKSSINRWNLDGNIPYLDPHKHLYPFLVSVVVALLLIPLSLFLLSIKYVYRLPNWSRVFSWINKLKPFFDAYTGAYKDKARFWTGLLLFVRILLLGISIADYSNNTIPYSMIITICLFLLGIMIYSRGVYKKRGLDLLECFFIVNISLVFLFNIYTDECKVSEENAVCWVSVVSHLLISSTFLVFLGIVAYHVYLKLSSFNCVKRLRPDQNITEDVGYEGLRGYDSVERLNAAKELVETQ